MKNALIVAALVLVAPLALADEHVLVLRPQTIHGRPDKPLAQTEVSKLPMTSALATPTQTFVARVAAPVVAAPF